MNNQQNPWENVIRISRNVLMVSWGSIPHLSGCNCQNECNADCPCVLRSGVSFPYYDNDNRIILDNCMLPLFECHEGCSCCSKNVTNCRNKAFGTLRDQLPVCDVRQTQHKGLGLFSTCSIRRGCIVVEYLGEVLSRSVAEQRIHSNKESHNYMLEVREHYADTVIHTYIDATHYGNESRFVNHSCDPNCTIQIIRTDTLIPHVVIVAVRDIQQGEEITFHYGGSAGPTSCPCYCGAANCQGYVPFSLLCVLYTKKEIKIIWIHLEFLPGFI